MNFIFSYSVQPYQISEKRTYLYIAKIDLTLTNLKVLCPVTPINIKLTRCIRLAFKRFNMYILIYL